MDIRQDSAFFGREKELGRLLKNLIEDRHTLLVGQSGVGKSSLMNEARLLLTGEKHRVDIQTPSCAVRKDAVLTVESPVPPWDCLRGMAEGLFRNRDLRMSSLDARNDWPALKLRFTHLGVRGMRSEVLKCISGSGKKYYLFVKNLHRISVTGLDFFESLLQVAVLCGSAIAVKDQEAFRGFWASFERITVERLPDAVARELISHLMSRYPVNVVDPVMCRNEILSSSDGNPFYIKNLLYRAGTEKMLGRREIRAFRAVGEGPFFNMGPLYMIGAGVLTAVKFFSVGAEGREHYIYYSAIGFMLYLTFRAFRGFFIFRPGRRK